MKFHAVANATKASLSNMKNLAASFGLTLEKWKNATHQKSSMLLLCLK
jgi:hypothetical protein